MLTHKDIPVFSFKDLEEFYEWLSKNYTQTAGFLLRDYKKNSEIPTIFHKDAVDVALCWGWVDGLINKFDDIYYVVIFTPRRSKSLCSKVNVAKVEKLIANGKMQPSGLVHVEAAKKDGGWDAAYEPASNMTMPQDFIDEIKKDKNAYDYYKTLNKSNLYGIYFKIVTTIDPVKRKAKITKIIQQLNNKKSFRIL